MPALTPNLPRGFGRPVACSTRESVAREPEWPAGCGPKFTRSHGADSSYLSSMHPSQRAIANYQGTVGEAYHVGKRGLPPAALPWVCRARAELFQPHVSGTDAVLEWGCGAGWNLAALRAGRRVGMDVEPALQNQVEASGAEFVATTRTLANASMDVIVSHHSLEHAPDPLAVLIELGRLLRPGGRILIAVPYENSRLQRHYNPSEPNHHLFAWNPQTLGNLVELTGLHVESAGLRSYGYDHAGAEWAVRTRLGERGFRWLRQLARWIRPIYEVNLVASRERTSPGLGD